MEAEKRIIELARVLPSRTDVPYAFEKRIMATVREIEKPCALSTWSRSLWRAAGPCVGVCLLVSAWSWWLPSKSAPDQSSEIELAVAAHGVTLDEAW